MDLTKEQQEFAKKNNIKIWPLGIHNAVYCLRALPFAPDSNYIFIKVDYFIELAELNYPRDLTELDEDILSWDLITIAKSALYFYLVSNQNGRKRLKNADYISYDWLYIAPVLLNKHVSKNIISMLLLFYFCPDQVKIAGVKRVLRKTYSSFFSRLQVSPESLNNLLLLLGIDEFSRALLIKNTFEDKNFKQIFEFLTIYERAVNS